VIKYYLNLTLGLDFYERYKKFNPTIIRIQSSHIERKVYNKIFYGLDNDLLYHLAMGDLCFIVDGSSNSSSKVIRIGIPVIEYVLNRIWFKQEIKMTGFDINWFRKIYRELEKDTRAKLKYFRNYLQKDKIQLYGISLKTKDR